ncbi:MAG: 23S rRNA (pseudouridine(1915)-N(3))-methyltransferase RlmH [Oscillospiraceae bacterium]|jgi:ribosomal RNA large subunit methyltransferase H|nr:MAG: 23S rRNA (pseudouridine(1915)-N(3))-methyltransferase RlmH [Oscillospiraceae bacterium]
MLGITIICVDKLREAYLREAAAEYEKRMSSYCRLKTIEVTGDSEIVSVLPLRAYKIALCIEGRQLSSEEFAEKIEDIKIRGYSEIAVIIGGTDGMSEAVKSKCNLRLSFSRMTFPHPLMRVILLEQLYRALNIGAGGKYHH